MARSQRRFQSLDKHIFTLLLPQLQILFCFLPFLFDSSLFNYNHVKLRDEANFVKEIHLRETMLEIANQASVTTIVRRNKLTKNRNKLRKNSFANKKTTEIGY